MESSKRTDIVNYVGNYEKSPRRSDSGVILREYLHSSILAERIIGGPHVVYRQLDSLARWSLNKSFLVSLLTSEDAHSNHNVLEDVIDSLGHVHLSESGGEGLRRGGGLEGDGVSWLQAPCLGKLRYRTNILIT